MFLHILGGFGVCVCLSCQNGREHEENKWLPQAWNIPALSDSSGYNLLSALSCSIGLLKSRFRRTFSCIAAHGLWSPRLPLTRGELDAQLRGSEEEEVFDCDFFHVTSHGRSLN